MSDSVLAKGGRLGLALAATVAAVALGAGVQFIPPPTSSPTISSIDVVPERTDQSLVCGGGALGLTRGADPELTVLAAPQRRSAGTGLVEASISESDALQGGAAIVTLPREAPAETLAAVESTSVDSPEVRGLSVAECIAPSRSSWLVGGSTEVGRTTWIVLSNAGAVDATVNLQVWGDTGEVDAPGLTGIIVAAGTQRIVPLAGFTVDQASTVVAVESTGGSVAATLQHSVVRGLDPGGVTIVTPQNAPAERLVIPALPVINGELVLERSSSDGGTDALTAVRMLAPGDTSAQVTLTLVPQSGGEPLALTATLEPGVVFDLPFTELADGDYSLVLDATAPIVAGARTSTAGATGLDVEWFSPAPELPAAVDVLAATAPLAGVVSSGSARLHLFAPDGPAVVDLDGSSIDVPARASVVVTVAANAALRLTSDAPVHASLSYRGDSALAGSRVLPPAAERGAVRVLPE